jgi:hypothetical protein
MANGEHSLGECAVLMHTEVFMAKKILKQETSEKVSFQIIPEVTLSDIAVKLDKIIELLQQIKLPRGGY